MTYRFSLSLIEIITSFPPVCWDAYFEAIGYRTVRAFDKGAFKAGDPVYLLSGFTDRLVALNLLMVYMKRRNKTGLKVKWLVNKSCGIVCPKGLIAACSPYLEIVNDDFYSLSQWFSKNWPKSGPLKEITKLFASGRICFGQPVEREALSVEEDILPFIRIAKKILNIGSDSDMFSVHIRGGDFAQVQDNRMLANSANLLKPLIRGRKVVVFSDDQVLAQTYCRELDIHGIPHLKRIRTTQVDQHLQTLEDFRTIASSSAIFVARNNMGKFASYAACVGDVKEVYVLDGNKGIDKMDCFSLLQWYTSLKYRGAFRYYKTAVKWHLKYMIQTFRRTLPSNCRRSEKFK